MSEIVLYGKSGCPFCDKAKMLLESKELKYKYVDVTENEQSLNYVKEYWTKQGKRPTVPLIVIDGIEIGGYTELVNKLK